MEGAAGDLRIHFYSFSSVLCGPTPPGSPSGYLLLISSSIMPYADGGKGGALH